MNINKKIRDGELNTELHNLITEKLMQIDSSDHLTYFFIQNRLLALSLSINFFSIFNTVSPEGGNFLRMIAAISFLLTIFFFAGSIRGSVQNWRFERFYKKFLYHLDLCHLHAKTPLEDIEKKVSKRLKSLAKELEYFEKECGKMSLNFSSSRKKLSDTHAFFLKLGLCKEDWGIYFDKTGNTEK